MAVKNSGRLALMGVMIALALVFLLLATLIPTTTVGLAALAGICGIPVVVELGRRAGLLHYVAVSVLSILLVPAVGGTLLYVGIFGHYTIFKAWIESKRLSRKWEWAVKLGLFLLLAFGGCLLLVRAPLSEKLPIIINEPITTLGFSLCLGIAVLVFVVYDRCLTGLVSLYHSRLRPHLQRLFRF